MLQSLVTTHYEHTYPRPEATDIPSSAEHTSSAGGVPGALMQLQDRINAKYAGGVPITYTREASL
jgi:hypothetical protein